MLIHHLGCSGGKDSTALLLWAIHESGLPRESLRVTFCDTHNEDKLTYEHLDMLRKKVAEPAGIVGGIEVLEPKHGFYEMVLKHHCFPNRRMQFCTHELKLYPTQKWVQARQNEGHTVVVLNGKRTAESNARKLSMAGKPEREMSMFWGCEEWAPLMFWSIQDVLAIHQRYKVPLNPLYALGAHRVGCFPCVNCGKSDLRMVAQVRPEKIKEIAKWERDFFKDTGIISTFFMCEKASKHFRTIKFVNSKGKEVSTAPIEKVVEWAFTKRGGKKEVATFGIETSEPKACWMNYGACE
jgi:3'-phosphoadenosine 5'-phosphosulfate sulfotransferase (PAPS reductase)/FAD synthetase